MANIRREKRQERRQERKARRAARRGEDFSEENLTQEAEEEIPAAESEETEEKIPAAESEETEEEIPAAESQETGENEAASAAESPRPEAAAGNEPEKPEEPAVTEEKMISAVKSSKAETVAEKESEVSETPEISNEEPEEPESPEIPEKESEEPELTKISKEKSEEPELTEILEKEPEEPKTTEVPRKESEEVEISEGEPEEPESPEISEKESEKSEYPEKLEEPPVSDGGKVPETEETDAEKTGAETSEETDVTQPEKSEESADSETESSADSEINETENDSDLQEEAQEESATEEPDGSEEDKVGFFRRLVRGLSKTRQNIVRGFDSIFSGHSSINDDFYEDLEEVLIMGDVGVHATEEILDRLREKVKENNIKDPADCREYLMNSIKEQMSIGETAYRFEQEKAVILVIGVNGVGKTTTIGKLAGKFKKDGKKVVLAAADTFRAAAAEQLTEWAHRAGVEIISGQEGSDPGAVVYDACQAAKARNADILICDTAGRLHNKKNLMAELEKIGRILTREYPDVYRETLVVLDATTGQNALNQAKQFNEVTDITGVVLTKMDGTAKGGIAVAIQSELGIPVKYIGVGETIDDLQKFDSDRFVDALFESGEEE